MKITDHNKFKFIFALMAVTLFTITTSAAYASDKMLCTLTIDKNKTKGMSELKTSTIEKVFNLDSEFEEKINLVRVDRIRKKKENDDGTTDLSYENSRILVFEEDDIDSRLSKRDLKKIEIEKIDYPITLAHKIYDDKHRIGFGVNGRVRFFPIRSNVSTNIDIDIKARVAFKGKKKPKVRKAKIDIECTVLTQDHIDAMNRVQTIETQTTIVQE
jgi:hypothetical protein